MLTPDPGFTFYASSRRIGEYYQRLRNNAARHAVSLVHFGTVWQSRDVMREPGCTKDGFPVYRILTDSAPFTEYVVGRTKNPPEGAQQIEGAPLWVKRTR